MNFNFTKLFTVSGLVFYVSVVDQKKSYLFTMVKDDERWRIIDAPKVPAWIHEIESALSSIIQ